MKYISLAVVLLLNSDVNAIKKTKLADISNVQIHSPIPRSSQEFQAQQKLTDVQKEDSLPTNKKSKKSSHAQHGDSSDDEKFVPAELDDKSNPEVTFERSYDHIMHKDTQLGMDGSEIGFKLTKKSIGQYCQEDDWLILRYKMYNMEDNSLLEDTDAASESHEPVIALIGKYQLPKCIDIAVQKMKQGEHATIKCPNHLDIGGASKNAWQSRFSNQQTWLNSKIDTKYELRVDECSSSPAYFKRNDHVETLSNGFPFFLMSGTKDKDGHELTLSVDKEDLYAPRKTGVHNVHLQKWKGRDHADPMQQWVWSADQTSLQSVGVPGTSLFEGFNKNLITYKYRGLANQRWSYNIGNKRFTNKFTGNAMDVVNDDMHNGANLLTNEPDSTDGQKWEIEYQNEAAHGHDH